MPSCGQETADVHNSRAWKHKSPTKQFFVCWRTFRSVVGRPSDHKGIYENVTDRTIGDKKKIVAIEPVFPIDEHMYIWSVYFLFLCKLQHMQMGHCLRFRIGRYFFLVFIFFWCKLQRDFCKSDIVYGNHQLPNPFSLPNVPHFALSNLNASF